MNKINDFFSLVLAPSLLIFGSTIIHQPMGKLDWTSNSDIQQET
jgi:hypothetical protein